MGSLSSEQHHRIAPEPDGDQIEALAIPAARDRKPELARSTRDVTITSARDGDGLHGAE